MRNKILSLLVLLLTAASGAWAQDPVAKDIVVSPESGTNISDAIKDALGTNGDWALNITINLAKGGTYTVTESIVPSASIIINGNDATIDASALTAHFIKMRKTPSYDKVESGEYVVTTPSKIENVTITGLTKALFYDNGTPYVFEDFTFDNCLINYLEQGSLIISLSNAMVINFTITNSTFYCLDKTKCNANCIAMSGKRPWQVTGFEDSEGKLLVDHNTFYNVAYKKQFLNTNVLKGQTKYKYEFNSNIFVNVSNKKIYGNMTNNKSQLTTDGLNTYIWDDTFFSETNYNGDEGLQSDPLFKDVENGDFTLDRRSLQYKNSTGDPRFSGTRINFNEEKTEASFNMLAYDATVNYELVRDIATGVRALVNNGAERIYVTKVENKFVPKEKITYKLTDVLDQNNQFDLVEGTDYEKVGMHILDGYTWENVTDESNLKPGTYEIIFKGLGKYDGKVYSQEFLLSNGYELTIAAGEYATFYHNEKLRIEDTDAELYTIASVSTTEAVLSEKMTVAPSETPLLVYNAGSETKTFLLIPTDDEASEALVAAEFRGTLAAKDMPASSTNMDYYVCTGKAFTWVRDAGQIAANRCWLQIGSGNQPAGTRASSRAITRGIGGIDGTTGIDAVDNGEVTNEGYYDLQGRKVQNPKRGGIYIHNGKKVIVR